MTNTTSEPRGHWLTVLVAFCCATLALSACSGSTKSGTVAAPVGTTSRITSASAAATNTPPPQVATTIPRTSSTTPSTSHPATAPSRPAPTNVSPAAASGCAATLAGDLAWTGAARQLVTVEAAAYSSQSATVTLWQRSASCWTLAGGPWSGHIGYNGFGDLKTEGDGRTPTGAYGFGPVIYGNAADPGVHEAYHRLVCGDWWDEKPGTSAYNTFQHVSSCSSTSPWAPDSSSEALWTETAPYPSFAVIDYNTGPVTSGAGSAIFLHASTGGPTSGCVSIPVGALDQFLRWMQPSDSPLIVMGPASEITRF